MTTIMDPTDERKPVRREITPRPRAISGTVALLDISKPRGSVLLDRLEERLSERLPGVTLKRYRKPTNTRVAPVELLQQIAIENHAVVLALSD